MIRRSLRRGLTLGLLGGAVLTAARRFQGHRSMPGTPAPLAPWVEPVDGACPATHPVKGKLTSKIFHVPGGSSYPRTNPDRCYLDAAAAEADGLRPTKR